MTQPSPPTVDGSGPRPGRGGLLLYSLSEFREIILECLDRVEARSVVEIGGEDGTFTAELLSWAAARDGRVSCIDPTPSPGLVDLVETSAAGELHRGTSLEALPRMPASDVYLVDGDHNYYTLLHELEAIEAISGGTFPLVFAHDVGWPSGRRDMYYAPGTLPPKAVHPHDYDRGAVVGSSDLVEAGFQGGGEFAWAVAEGGPANGVLTAVEAFLADRPHLELAIVPCVFGLGVIFPAEAPWVGAVGEVLGRYVGNPLLERLEQNRLDLYLRVLEQQHEQFETSLGLRDLQVENRALWARVHDLERELAEVSNRSSQLAGELLMTAGARSFTVAERLSRLHARGSENPGISGARMRALAESLQSVAGTAQASTDQ
ncbi:MAG: class I SAM-dependent methyltransferase [Acidimicrobiales bacterium]